LVERPEQVFDAHYPVLESPSLTAFRYLKINTGARFMTRLAVLADIHGNLSALEAAIADMAQFDVDQVVVAGDVVNWGPFSAQVVERIVQENWAVIRGNNELYLLDYQTPRAPKKWDSYVMIPWMHKQLKGKWQTSIAGWPDTLQLRFPDAPPVRVFHGIPDDPFSAIFPKTPEDEVQAMLADVTESTIIAGHHHLVMDRQVGRWHILNPGSLGEPLNGNPDGSYMILEGTPDGWEATVRRVSFDLELVLAEFERLRIVEECGIVGHIVIEEFKSAKLIILPFWEWCRLEHPGETPSKPLLDEFLKIDYRRYMPLHYAEIMAVPEK
jgi:predicted phosphodiesterase